MISFRIPFKNENLRLDLWTHKFYLTVSDVKNIFQSVINKKKAPYWAEVV